MELTSKERAKLRSVASTVSATSIIGTNGVTDNVIEQIKMDFLTREIVKVKVLPGSGNSPKECMEVVAEKTNSTPVCTIGNFFVVYKVSTRKGVKHILEI